MFDSIRKMYETTFGCALDLRDDEIANLISYNVALRDGLERAKIDGTVREYIDKHMVNILTVISSNIPSAKPVRLYVLKVGDQYFKEVTGTGRFSYTYDVHNAHMYRDYDLEDLRDMAKETGGAILYADLSAFKVLDE